MTTRDDLKRYQSYVQDLIEGDPSFQEEAVCNLRELTFIMDDILAVHDFLDELDTPGFDPQTQDDLDLLHRVQALFNSLAPANRLEQISDDYVQSKLW